MVHPLMRQSHKTDSTSETLDSIANSIIAMLSRLHVLVIGPGLGRDPLMQDTCAKVIQAAKRVRMPFVLDADGLYLAQTRPELVRGYSECILTPNVVEFRRLAKALDVEPSAGGPVDNKDGNGNGNGKGGGDGGGDSESQACARLSRALGGVLVVQKGARDYISDGERTLVSDGPGGRKRSGGQGDTLTGCLATLLAYRKAYLDGLWEVEGGLGREESLMLAAYGGSALTRECSRLAFAKNGRSMLASDLTEMVPVAFENLIGEKEESGL